MAGRMSNRDRIARMAAEAEVARQEQAAKKVPAASKPASRSKARAKAAPARVRIVWAVCEPSGAQVKTYPYAQEEAAQADARERTTATGRTHFVTKAEVPFDG